MSSEFDFIEWIRSRQRATKMVQLPAGDDLAILKWRGDDLLLVGVDQVLDGVHFDSSIHSPHAIGRKAMNRNLSDCAAMGCLPAAALVGATLPRGRDIAYAKELYCGLQEAADAHECQIVGGDTASWSGKLALTVTILGRAAGHKPITRGGSKPGDFIYVTGPLGGSMLGRHMTFKPRVARGRQLSEPPWRVSAMIDISDGLSRDLGHICDESKVGAVIEAISVPVHDDAIEMRRDGRSPLEHALHDGEDYELLFTSPLGTLDLGTRIGTITAEGGVWLESSEGRKPLEPKGWEHTF